MSARRGALVFGRRWYLALSLWLCLAGQTASAQQPVLEVGLMPIFTARGLLLAFEPMRAYLEKSLGQPVHLSSARNLRDFYLRTQNREFDLVVTPAHFAWLAHRESGYVPLLTYEQNLECLLLVNRNSALQRVADLRGKRIGLIDPLAMVSMRGQQMLRENGLQGDLDYSMPVVRPFTEAVAAVVQGELDATIISASAYRVVEEPMREQLRVLEQAALSPNSVYMANPRLSATQQQNLRAALLAFAETTQDGQKFMLRYQYGGFKPVSVAHLKTVAPYAEEAKRLILQNK